MNLIKVTLRLSILLNFLFLQCSGGQNKNSNNNVDSPLKLVATVPLPGVNGRIDHLAYNRNRHLLYIAALGNNTLEVVDLKTKKVIQSIRNLAEPQGILYLPEKDVIFVANGGNGICKVFNAKTYEETGSIKLNGDADNVRYDPASGKIYVGFGEGSIAIIDGVTFNQMGEVKLPGHPESFQLNNKVKKLFVNVPGARLIDAIDLNKRKIEKEWRIEDARSNFPMALDTTHNRLFIGCRRPSELLVMSSITGDKVASLNIDSDTDDIFYDENAGLIYVSCGGGYIDIIRQIDSDNYKILSKIKTRSGARTALFVPDLNELFLAAPARTGNEAQIMIYKKQ